MSRDQEPQQPPPTAMKTRQDLGRAVMMADVARAIRGLGAGGAYWIARTTEGVVEVVRADGSRGACWFVSADHIGSVLRSFVSGADASLRRLVVVARRSQIELLDIGSDVFDVLAHPLSPLRVELVLRNAFEGIERLIEREAASRALLRTEYEERTLIDIASALAAERNIDRLLSIMLERFRAITGADAGSVWILERGADGKGSDQLRFCVCQNDSMPLAFEDLAIPVDQESIVGYAARTGVPVHVADCYDLPAGAPFRFSRTMDERTGYQTRSMLTVPMVNRQSRVIGVIQLINRKREPARILTDATAFAAEVIPFSRHEVELATTLAVHGAVSLENVSLYEHIQALFDRFVEASVRAIESRDPATSGHSRRVAALSLGLLETVDRCERGPFADLSFAETDFQTLRYASLLHDYGKVTVPEQVLLKAKKLHPWELDRVVDRVQYIMKDLERQVLARKLALVERHGYAEAAKRFPAMDAELGHQLGVLSRRLEWVHELNEPSVVHDAEDLFSVEALGKELYRAFDGTMQPLLRPGEVTSLTVRRGSLTPEEYQTIQDHVLQTWKFLEAIPWTDGLEAVPDIALMHHEKLDGSGYPFGVGAAQIPIPARVLSICDIFDALGAADRPYKPAVPLERALDILRYEANAQKIDPELLELFVEARVWDSALSRIGQLEAFGPRCSRTEPHQH